MGIKELLNEKIVICDGAMGTMLQAAKAPMGKHPELLNITHPEIIEEIHLQYYQAGSDFVSTNTFGANRYKLEGSGHSTAEVISAGIAAAKRAARKAEDADRAAGTERTRYVALDVSPVGKMMEPVGDMTFEEAHELYTEQIMAGADAGADFILFETYTDICELRAGIIAAKECCELPIFCSVTFQEDGRMLMGTDPITMVNLLQDLGVDALGVNCSLGPKQMVPIVNQILTESHVPVLVQPNAGLPRVENGETVFDVTIEEYTEIMTELAEAGLRAAGGCCGTSPEYIASLSKSLSGKKPVTDVPGRGPKIMAVCSGTKTVKFDGKVVVIGERINPTGKKALKEALKTGDYTYVENEAIRQTEAGAQILDVNVGLPEIDEKAAMLEAVRRLSNITDTPLQIDSASPEVLEAAVRVYNGKPIINSVNGKKAVMEAVFPIAKKYGANIIALTLDENGLPDSAETRLEIAERIILRAAEYGIGPERILVDCLTLTVSAEPLGAVDTLSAIRTLKERYAVKTTLGASNVSFGLPNRRLLNAAFLTAAMYAGLDAPITDPLVPEYMDAVFAFSALFGKDPGASDYIEKYKDVPAKPAAAPAAGQGGTGVSAGGGGAANGGANGAGADGSAAGGALNGGVPKSGSGFAKGSAGTAAGATAAEKTPAEALMEIVRKGWQDRAAAVTEELLKQRQPLSIVEEIIIPALEQVGKDYETGRSFLPQLIRSADTVSAAFEVLKKAMAAGGEEICYGKIILATVEGDIHDIGKNIVKVLLENYGYEIIDLGKDVPVQSVVEAAQRERIEMVGLSALMTTTVVNMERTIQALREAGLACRIAVGGAVLTRDYAEKIGADYYCKEAMDTVRAANALFRK